MKNLKGTRNWGQRTRLVLVLLSGVVSFAHAEIIKLPLVNNIDGEMIKVVYQSKKVSGVVTDEKGEPMIGLTVSVKNGTQGVITDMDGRFQMEVPQGAILQFSFIGFVTQELEGKVDMKVVMREDAQTLDEVVVVGYGVQKKVNLTGSVASVNMEKQKSRPINNISSALSGLVPGMTARVGSGEPGSDGATLLIRGNGTLNNSSPMVIVDGMPAGINAVNPQDIENISVLKDAASCAIYGSRAANGVILITTKKGNREKVNVSYTANFSYQTPSNLVRTVSDYPTYMRLINEAARNSDKPELFSEETILEWEEARFHPNDVNEFGVPNWVSHPNTDWQDALYDHRGLAHQHTLSVDGGSQNTRYLLSASYWDNPGIVDNTGWKRYSVRANVEVDAKKWLTLGTRTYAYLNTKEQGNYSQAKSLLYATTPGITPYWNGMYGAAEAKDEFVNVNNPLYTLNSRAGKNEDARFNTTLYSKVKFLNHFSWDFNFNYNRSLSETTSHDIPLDRWAIGRNEIVFPADPADQLNTSFSNSGTSEYTLENLLHYNQTFANKHDISVLLGYNESYYKSWNNGAAMMGLPDETIYVPNVATEMKSINGTESDNAMRSYFGRVNYAYKSRYLFEVNMRYDGSSKFARGHRWGLFPSFSVGWRISEESFMKSASSWLNNLKLRVSWGKLGNNSIGNYDYMATYSAVDYNFQDKVVVGQVPWTIANEQLKWESTTITNIGLDLGVLDSRLKMEMDVYNKVTDGILTNPPIFITVGNKTAPKRNTAEVQNKGVELTLGWQDKVGKVDYYINGNFAYNHNKITKYKGALVKGWITDEFGNETYVNNYGDVSGAGVEGYMYGEYYIKSIYKGNGSYFNPDGSVNIHGGPKDGMIRTESDMEWVKAMVEAGYTFMPKKTVEKKGLWYGDLIYTDRDGDGIYGDTDDSDFNGKSSQPKFNFGLSMGASWKGFDLSMVWAGCAGFYLYNCNNVMNQPYATAGKAVGAMVACDHYYYNEGDSNDPTPNNLYATFPRIRLDDAAQNTEYSEFYLYNGNYLKLKNLSVGYTFPKTITNRFVVQGLRVFFSGENLCTITDYPGLDPEAGAGLGYPSMRQYSFGATITF